MDSHSEIILVDFVCPGRKQPAMPKQFSGLQEGICKVWKAGFHAWIGKMLAKCLYVGLE